MTTYTCPLCQSPLKKVNHSQVCQQNHHFDIAKEGYVNLLPVQAKSSKQPGDNQSMMLARRAFLNSEGYRPLADKLAKLCHQYLTSNKTSNLLDLGCGEGYYTHHVAEALPQSKVYGLDISKVAVRYAAKRYKNIDFCVASAFNAPFSDHFFDMVIRVYAPSKAQELVRLIKKNGYLITVTPAPRHLWQLREVIYEQVKAHSQEQEMLSEFHKEQQIRLTYPLKITHPQQLLDLINMTPFAWKMTSEMREKLLQKENIEIECDFNIEVFKYV